MQSFISNAFIVLGILAQLEVGLKIQPVRVGLKIQIEGAKLEF